MKNKTSGAKILSIGNYLPVGLMASNQIS